MRWFRKRRLWGRYDRLRPATQRRLRIAVPYFVAGVLTLVVTYMLSDPPNWLAWVLFAGFFVLLEVFAVEVNDRMLQSSGVMVIMTAGVILALEPGSDAMFGMALMGAVAMFTPLDFKERRWFQPMTNFGQMVVAAAVAGFLLDVNLGHLEGASTDDLVRVAVASSLVSS